MPTVTPPESFTERITQAIVDLGLSLMRDLAKNYEEERVLAEQQERNRAVREDAERAMRTVCAALMPSLTIGGGSTNYPPELIEQCTRLEGMKGSVPVQFPSGVNPLTNAINAPQFGGRG